MPSYDYKCSKCENTAIIVAGMKEKINPPMCHQQEMTRKFSAPPIQFKGQGFNASKG